MSVGERTPAPGGCRLLVLGFAMLALWLVPAGAVGQWVDIGIDDIFIRNASGGYEGLWLDGADLYLGGDTRDGDLYLRNSADGANVIVLNATEAIAVIGGASGLDGDLHVLSSSGAPGVLVDGESGNLTNSFSGNGLVKAWARINFDGTVASCFQCNPDTLETRFIDSGRYEVDFNLFGADISSRPWLCSVGHGGVEGSPVGQIGCVRRSSDPSSIFVEIQDDDGLRASRPFTVVVF